GVTEQEVRDTLIREGAIIIAGPTQLGEYSLKATGRSITALEQAMRQTNIIISLRVDTVNVDQ
ncbi:hypothetical protein ABTL64_19730, partial [Acinetobacter baumannii]